MENQADYIINTENYIGKSFSNLNDYETSLFKSRKFFSSPWAKLIPKEIIGSHRFDTKLKVGEDSLFMAEISGKVRGIKKTDKSACYYVYQREKSASREKVVCFYEIKRVVYLLVIYGKMILKGEDFLFIVSRIVASIFHLGKIFKKRRLYIDFYNNSIT